MHRIVVLGAGFAGLTLASELDGLAEEGKASVTLVERNDRFSMGFTMQWALAGRRALEEGARPYASLQARHAAFVHDEVVGIDPGPRVVVTKSGPLAYDSLVVALGAELAPELLAGLSEGAYNLYDPAQVTQFRDAVARLEEGVVTILVASTPFKCPPAPYEYAFLVDDLLRARGVRERVRVVLTTPEPQPMPVAGKAVGDQVRGLLAERGIGYFPGHKPKAVGLGRQAVIYEGGEEVPYTVLGAVPPHRAPKPLREAGLADASGFVPVELGTFRTSFDGVYAVGDVAAIRLPNGGPHPKAGVFAEAQALAVARALAAEIEGREAPGGYAGKGVCFVDVGRDQAAPAEVDLLGKDGPSGTIRPPSADGLAQKRVFERERFERWFGG